MDTKKNNRYVYICVFLFGGEKRITSFDNADAMLDWEDALRENSGTICWSGKTYVYSGVAGYPSGEVVNNISQKGDH